MYPIINRGTWTRVQSVRQVIYRFIQAQSEEASKIQIVSIGAGYDTTYFWIQDLLQNDEQLRDKIVYVEIDYFDVVSKKIQTIKAKQEISRHLKPIIEETSQLLNTSNYKIIAGDLRDTLALAEKLNHT